MNYAEAKLAIEDDNTSYNTLKEAAQLFRDKYQAARKASNTELDIEVNEYTLVTTKIRVTDEGGQRYGVNFISDHSLEQPYIDRIVESILWNEDYTQKPYITGMSTFSVGYKTVERDACPVDFWNPNGTS